MHAPVDPRQFRNALGTFATGVAVITTRGPRGELVGNTANSFNAVSLEPPLVLWSLGRSALSFKAYLSTDHFAINVLREEQRHLSTTFAQALADKWSDLAFETWDTGCPILTEALANFECRTRATYEGGDHVIFLGEVIRMRSVGDGRPLLYFRGDYSALKPAEASNQTPPI